MNSREKLIAATLELLCQHGYRGTTTKAIAELADLSEVTLFRQFGSKAKLTVAALTHASQPFRDAIQSPTNDLEADLTALASAFVQFVDEWPALIDRVLPEVAGQLEDDQSTRAIIAENIAATVALIKHHQADGRLTQAPTAEVVRGFIGPLITRASLRHLLPTDAFNATEHTTRFLAGYATPEP